GASPSIFLSMRWCLIAVVSIARSLVAVSPIASSIAVEAAAIPTSTKTPSTAPSLARFVRCIGSPPILQVRSTLHRFNLRHHLFDCIMHCNILAFLMCAAIKMDCIHAFILIIITLRLALFRFWVLLWLFITSGFTLFSFLGISPFHVGSLGDFITWSLLYWIRSLTHCFTQHSPPLFLG